MDMHRVIGKIPFKPKKGVFQIEQGLQISLDSNQCIQKYGWIVPLKTKSGKEVAQAFRKLFLNGHPIRIRALNSTSNS